MDEGRQTLTREKMSAHISRFLDAFDSWSNPEADGQEAVITIPIVVPPKEAEKALVSTEESIS